MKTQLDRFLDSIHPSLTLDDVDSCADEAIISFRVDAVTVTDWNEFKGCLIRFLRHVETQVLRLRSYPDASSDFLWGRCVQFLCKAFGANGDKSAFEMARTGNEGGLYAVLKSFATAVARQYSGGGITGRVLTFWNGLSSDEKLAVTSEYIAKHGHLLPYELTEGSAARLRENFPKVLEEHPRLLRRLGRIGRD